MIGFYNIDDRQPEHGQSIIVITVTGEAIACVKFKGDTENIMFWMPEEIAA